MSNKNNNIYPVGAIKHDNEHRASIPTTELAGEESVVVETMTPEGQYAQFKHEFNRGCDPELYWLGKYKNDDEDTQSPDLRVDTRSLYRHEEINPEMISEQYIFPSEDDFTGTIGDENEWIFEKFTDRRLRWVYIFTDEDYDRAKAMYDERMANYGSGEK